MTALQIGINDGALSPATQSPGTSLTCVTGLRGDLQLFSFQLLTQRQMARRTCPWRDFFNGQLSRRWRWLRPGQYPVASNDIFVNYSQRALNRDWRSWPDRDFIRVGRFGDLWRGPWTDLFGGIRLLAITRTSGPRKPIGPRRMVRDVLEGGTRSGRLKKTTRSEGVDYIKGGCVTNTGSCPSRMSTLPVGVAPVTDLKTKILISFRSVVQTSHHSPTTF